MSRRAGRPSLLPIDELAYETTDGRGVSATDALHEVFHVGQMLLRLATARFDESVLGSGVAEAESGQCARP